MTYWHEFDRRMKDNPFLSRPTRSGVEGPIFRGLVFSRPRLLDPKRQVTLQDRAGSSLFHYPPLLDLDLGLENQEPHALYPVPAYIHQVQL